MAQGLGSRASRHMPRARVSTVRRGRQITPKDGMCCITLKGYFFSAYTMHARGSDGHQNVLWSISYSHVVREQVKSKKPGVFTKPKQNSQTQTQTNKHATEEDTQKVKHYAFRKHNFERSHIDELLCRVRRLVKVGLKRIVVMILATF